MKRMGMVVAMLLAVGLGGCVSECEKAGRDFSNAHDVFMALVEEQREEQRSGSSTAIEGKAAQGVLDRREAALSRVAEACR